MATAEESNRKKFSNWMQSVQSIDITKKALHDHVLDVWTKRLMSWSKDERDAITYFIRCVANNKINLCRKKWTCECKHRHCAEILKLLLNLQQNPGVSIVWNSNLCDNIANGIKIHSQDERHIDGIDDIPRVETTSLSEVPHSLYNLSQNSTETRKSPDGGEKYKGIFDDCKREHVWCIANMFMQRGKNKTNIFNTGPPDTDAAMFFRMMKNCKLFEIENENDLYDKIIDCRDRLHHSATNRIPRATAKPYFDIMIDILEKFEVPDCKKAKSRIKEMLEETILCISVPDINIELANQTLKQKQKALEVDKETDMANGLCDADTNGLLEDTLTALENAEDSENTFEGAKSPEDYKQAIKEYEKEISKLKEETKSLGCRQKPGIRPDDKGNKIKNPKKFFELMTNLLQESLNNPDIAADIESQLNPVLDQIVDTASESDASFRKKVEDISKQVNSLERTELQQSDTKSGNTNITADGQTGRNKDTDFSETVKDPQKHFENMTSLLQKFAHNHRIAEAISKEINPLLDEIVENASKSDETLREKIKEVHKKENSEQQTREDIDQRQSQDQDSNATDHDAGLNRGNADSRRPHQQSPTTEVGQEPGTYRPHLWSVASKQSYNIKAEQDKNCDIWDCCRLPTGEILLADYINRRLKKLDARYQVVSVCDLTESPMHVCCISNNEAVVYSVRKELQFVDLVSMTLTKSVKHIRTCSGLTCHGDNLYILAPPKVCLYRTDVTAHSILYSIPFKVYGTLRIKVNDEGSKIYILTRDILITIDSEGNHLFTLDTQNLYGASDLCVDGEGHILVCELNSDRILQLHKHDDKHIIRMIANQSNDIVTPRAICFDRHKSTLTCAGGANSITVLQLE